MASQPNPPWLFEDELSPADLDRLRKAATTQREAEAVKRTWRAKVRRLLISAAIGALVAFIAIAAVESYRLLRTSTRVRNAVVNLITRITPERPAKKVSAAPPTRLHQAQPRSRQQATIRNTPELRQLGPLEVYVLNGDEYILVNSSGKVALMDVKTGTIRWLPETSIPPPQAVY